MKVLLIGCNGKMGQNMQKYMQTNNIDFVGIDKHNIKLLNTKLNVDIVVDYSSYLALEQNLSFCIKNKLPMVVATTNHTQKNLQLISDAKNIIPIFITSNFSFLFNFMLKILNGFNTLKDYDFAVTEVHHKYKKDKPSGSCKMMLQSLQKFNISPQVNCFRVGEVVGEHSITVYGKTEVLKIKHTALSRTAFCEGTIKACKFLLNKKPGIYNMENLFDSL